MAAAYGWVAFTSANGVDRTWEALAAAGAERRAFGATRVAAIGPATARALERRGIRADLVAKEFRGESPRRRDALRACGAGRRASSSPVRRVARDALPEALRGVGWEVDVVPVYETRPTSDEVVDRLTRELAEGRIDAVTFTSSSTVDSLCDRLGSGAAKLLAGPRIASIGPVTTAAALERGLRVDVTARQYPFPASSRRSSRATAETLPP